jgi:putative copper export protein
VGHALAWRAVGIVVAGAALLAVRFAPGSARRIGLSIAAASTLAVMAVHVAAGHAAGGRTKDWASIAAQSGHFAAVGLWLGGLAALLFALRGAPSESKSRSIGRFSTVAVIGLVVVLTTGLVRAFVELSGWDDLWSTGYGRAVMAKTLLIGGIALLAAVNRWRNLPQAATSLQPLRRTSRGELTLAAIAVAVAAMLGTLSPPSATPAAAVTGLAATGNDFATTVRVRLTAPSAEPGPNRFTVSALDYDSKQPVAASGVSLRFTSLDDPGIAPSTLSLSKASAGTYSATGANLSVDGHWRISTLIEEHDRSVTVPLSVNLLTPPQFVSVTRVPGEAPFYAVQIADETNVLFTVDPERPGANTITVTFADVISDERSVADMVLTLVSPEGRVEQPAVRRVSRGAFTARVVLESGSTAVSATAHTVDGTRLRAAFDLRVAG